MTYIIIFSRKISSRRKSKKGRTETEGWNESFRKNLYALFKSLFSKVLTSKGNILSRREKNDNQFSICLDFLFRCFQQKSHLDFQKSGYGHGTNLWYYNIIFRVTFRQTKKQWKKYSTAMLQQKYIILLSISSAKICINVRM